MGIVERYFRNRLKLQIFANYLGVIGSGFFALQNLTTNWGGDYRDDSSLTSAVKVQQWGVRGTWGLHRCGNVFVFVVQANPKAGLAWDEQYLQVGGLLVTWCLYVLGTELQGNLTPGRYKRVMTWMVNVPVIAFMIGNMILSTRRVDDGVETSSAKATNIGFGIGFIILSLGCIGVFAFHPIYKAEQWLKVKDSTLTDRLLKPSLGDKPSWHNNRFWPQFLLHLLVIVCLLYFMIVGYVHYDSGDGWLLTDAYKADALAVKVWGIAGASVGMMAMPALLMFVGFELQGDLPPNNFKPLAVWVGCITIFLSSAFMFTTAWDAHQEKVATSFVMPLIIMLVLCIWAIVMVVCYAVVDKYEDAYWIKILADPIEEVHQPLAQQPVWSAKPLVVGAGHRHFDLAWQPVPGIPPNNVEYVCRAAVP